MSQFGSAQSTFGGGFRSPFSQGFGGDQQGAVQDFFQDQSRGMGARSAEDLGLGTWNPATGMFETGGAGRRGKFQRSRKDVEAAIRRDQLARGGAMPELFRALAFDTIRQQGAADELFNRGNQAISDFGSFVDTNAQRMIELGDEQAGTLRGIGQGLEETGQSGLDQFESGVRESRGLLQGQISKSERYAQQAVTGLTDDTNIQATNAVSGMNQRMASEKQRIASDPNLTAAQKRDMSMQLSFQTQQAAGGIIAQIKTRFNETRAGLRMQQANVSASGAQVLGGFESTVQGQRNVAIGERNRMQQAGAAFRAGAESIRTAALAAASQFGAQGREAMFNMIQQNPRGIVSIFAGLSSLLGAITQPGAQGIPGFGSQQNAGANQNLFGQFSAT